MFLIFTMFLGLSATVPAKEISFPLVKSGKNIPVIYYAKGQEFAAKELGYILEKMTKVKFTPEPYTKAVKTPSFIIGKTPEAENAGADFSKFAPDEWFVKKAGEKIILAGGSNQGSLYAVYELMEKFAGVSFPALDVEVIPEKTFLLIPEDLYIQGKPAFLHRTIYDGIAGGNRNYAQHLIEKRRLFNTRNRESAIKRTIQYDVCTQYNAGHNLYFFVDPDKYFKTNPEYFSMNEKGKRFLGKNKYVGSQLCMTNKDIVKITVESLKKYIKKDRAALPKEKWPVIYKISQLDSTNFICLCPDCKKLTEKEGNESALIIHYLNAVVQEINKTYPEIKIGASFYVSTEEVPKTLRPHKNLICEWNDLYSKGDLYRPFTSKFNTARRKIYERWTEVTPHGVSLWDYHNMGATTVPPRLETVVDSLAADLKYFHSKGTVRYISEMQDGVIIYGATQLFLDLQYYVGKRLLIDPSLEPEKLIKHFMHHYYGLAEKSMTEILTRVRKGVKSEPNKMILQIKERSYQTGKFIRPVLELWQKAMKETRPGTIYRTHVEQDGMIILGAALRKQGLLKGKERKELLTLYKKIAEKRIKTLVSEKHRKKVFKRLEEMIREFELSQIIVETPAEFRHIPKDRIFVYGWPHFREYSHKPDQVIYEDDPSSPAKRAAIPPPALAAQYEQYKPSSFGVYDFASKQSLVNKNKKVYQDEKYHWIYAGRADIQPGSFFWAFRWVLQIPFAGVWQLSDGIKEGNKWHVYVSARFTGPAYVKGSKSPNKLYIDYVVLTRDKVKLNRK